MPSNAGPSTASSRSSRKQRRKSRNSGSGAVNQQLQQPATSTSTTSSSTQPALPSLQADGSSSFISASTAAQPSAIAPILSAQPARPKGKRSSSTAQLSESPSTTDLGEAGLPDGSGEGRGKAREKKRKRKRPSEAQESVARPADAYFASPVVAAAIAGEPAEGSSRPRERGINQEAMVLDEPSNEMVIEGQAVQEVAAEEEGKKDKGKGKRKGKGKEREIIPPVVGAAPLATLTESAPKPIEPPTSTLKSAGGAGDALRERANRMKENEARERELAAKDEEIRELKEGLKRMRKEVDFKNSELVSQKETISTVKHSLTCSICLELMYQPFLISPCGHTACFTCLLSWFLSPPPGQLAPPAEPNAPPRPPKKNKTCPNCRSSVHVPPTPIYFIKDLVSSIGPMLVLEGGGLGPPVEEEKKDEDIWAGIFKKKEARRLIRDEDDGVERCGDCGHEVDEGICTGCGRVYFSSDEDDDANSDDDSVLDMLYGEHDRIDADGNPIYVEDAEGFQFGDDSDQDEERSEDGSELSGDWLVRDDEGDEATWTEGEDEDFVENPDEIEDVLLSRGIPQAMLERFSIHALTIDSTILLRIFGWGNSSRYYNLRIYPDEADLVIDARDPAGVEWIKQRLFREEGRLGKRWIKRDARAANTRYCESLYGEAGDDFDGSAMGAGQLDWSEEQFGEYLGYAEGWGPEGEGDGGDSDDDEEGGDSGNGMGGRAGLDRILADAARLGRRRRVVELDSDESEGEEQRVAPGPRWTGTLDDSDEDEDEPPSRPVARRGPIVLSDSEDGSEPAAAATVEADSPQAPAASRRAGNRRPPPSSPTTIDSSSSSSEDSFDEGDSEDEQSEDTRSRLKQLRERFSGVENYEGGAEDGGDLLGGRGSDDEGEGGDGGSTDGGGEVGYSSS